MKRINCLFSFLLFAFHSPFIPDSFYYGLGVQNKSIKFKKNVRAQNLLTTFKFSVPFSFVSNEQT